MTGRIAIALEVRASSMRLDELIGQMTVKLAATVDQALDRRHRRPVNDRFGEILLQGPHLAVGDTLVVQINPIRGNRLSVRRGCE